MVLKKALGLILIVLTLATCAAPNLASEFGDIETVAGSSGDSNVQGRLSELRLDRPQQVKVGPDGRVWIVDRLNQRVVALDLTRDSYEEVIDVGQVHPGRVLPTRIAFHRSAVFITAAGDDNLQWLLRFDLETRSLDIVDERQGLGQDGVKEIAILGESLYFSRIGRPGLEARDLQSGATRTLVPDWFISSYLTEGRNARELLTLGVPASTQDETFVLSIGVDSETVTVLTNPTGEFPPLPDPPLLRPYSYMYAPAPGPDGRVYAVFQSGSLRYIGAIDSEASEVELIAGVGTPGLGGDGGPALEAEILATSIAVGDNGDLYVLGGDRLRRIVGVAAHR